MKGVEPAFWVLFREGETLDVPEALFADPSPTLSGFPWHANNVPNIRAATPNAAHQMWNERTFGADQEEVSRMSG